MSTTKVTFTYISSSGIKEIFSKESMCLQIMGKVPCQMQTLHMATKDMEYLPHTITFESLGDTIYPKDALAIEIAKKVCGINPAMRTCITPVEDIVRTGKATFDIANYSYNEVMFCMFHLRLLFNSHCVWRSTSPFFRRFVGKSGLSVMHHVLSTYRCDWRIAYLCALDIENDYHLNDSDASLIVASRVSVDLFSKWVKGEITSLGFDEGKLIDFFSPSIYGYNTYQRNIRSLLMDSPLRKDSLLTLVSMAKSVASRHLIRVVRLNLFGRGFYDYTYTDTDPIREYVEKLTEGFAPYLEK
jgi:hypothetical protein